jgi:hypothetical protein
MFRVADQDLNPLITQSWKEEIYGAFLSGNITSERGADRAQGKWCMLDASATSGLVSKHHHGYLTYLPHHLVASSTSKYEIIKTRAIQK